MTRLSPALLEQIEATLQTPLPDEQAPLVLVCQEVRACWMERAELLRDLRLAHQTLREYDRTIKVQAAELACLRDARVQAEKAQLAESCAQ